MLCADALAMSRSSTHLMTTAHTRASCFFLPKECGAGSYHRGYHDVKIAAENSIVLQLERPYAEVRVQPEEVVLSMGRGKHGLRLETV